MQKLLIICGPTATGKTSFGLQAAKKFKGEIVSADSRQVYTGMDIVTGKDLPSPEIRRGEGGEVKWHNRFLKYYLINGIRVWLYDVVAPDEEFNVSFWKECADLVIADIHKRHKLPIIVGGTGLYIKSITQNLDQIDVSPDKKLRDELAGKSPADLLNHLAKLDQSAADSLNDSDRKNPRRLIRAIEKVTYNSPSLRLREGDKGGEFSPGYQLQTTNYQLLQICLTAPKEFLNSRIDQRVDERVAAGATDEAKKLLQKYPSDLPSMTSSGYRAFLDPVPVEKWKILEHQYARRQLIWFKKQPLTHWFDISVRDWQIDAIKSVSSWYNKIG